MKLVFLALLLVGVWAGNVFASQRITVASYNVLNLFDTQDDPGKDDSEFLPGGKAKWTEKKLELKLKQLEAGIRSLKADVIALPEVENIRVLKMLNNRLKDLKYTPVLIEGGDTRGIDVGFLTKFPLDRQPLTHIVEDMNDSLWKRPTRPVVEVVVRVTNSTRMGFLLNHWPSRRNPEEQRCRAGEVVREVLLERMEKEPDIDYVVMGDLNDEPEDTSITDCLGSVNAKKTLASTKRSPKFFNAYHEKRASRKARATYYYGREDVWNALDHIVMTKGMLKGGKISYVPGSFSSVKNSLTVMNKDFNHPGGWVVPAGAPIPFTVFDDGRVVGISDHLPVKAEFEVNETGKHF